MGILDRTFRVLIAIVILILYYLNLISGTAAIVLLVFAGVFILTSFMSYCPLYSILDFRTTKSSK